MCTDDLLASACADRMPATKRETCLNACSDGKRGVVSMHKFGYVSPIYVTLIFFIFMVSLRWARNSRLDFEDTIWVTKNALNNDSETIPARVPAECAHPIDKEHCEDAFEINYILIFIYLLQTKNLDYC